MPSGRRTCEQTRAADQGLPQLLHYHNTRKATPRAPSAAAIWKHVGGIYKFLACLCRDLTRPPLEFPANFLEGKIRRRRLADRSGIIRCYKCHGNGFSVGLHLLQLSRARCDSTGSTKFTTPELYFFEKFAPDGLFRLCWLCNSRL